MHVIFHSHSKSRVVLEQGAVNQEPGTRGGGKRDTKVAGTRMNRKKIGNIQIL